MPIDNFVVNTNSPKGPMLKTLNDTIMLARNLARQIKEIMDQQTDGTTYTTLEGQFGLAAGNGSPVYNLVAGLTGTTGALEAAAVTQFTSRVN